MNSMQRAAPRGASAIAALVAFLSSFAYANPVITGYATPETIRVELPNGNAEVDVFLPASKAKAAMVIVVHGFSRHRQNMSGWGEHLAKEGFVVVVPDLPAWSDHVRNGRFISELRTHMIKDKLWTVHVDPTRIGLLGFSAGGLSSLLSAADDPDLAIWVGLDPVDQDGLGARAAAVLKARALVLTSEPSACNGNGNALGIVAALPESAHFKISGAVHIDAEWPSTWLAELVCGRSTDESRAEFRWRATKALKDGLALPGQ